jgi:hypothetical protein
MRRAIIISVSLLLCGFWFLLFMVQEGDQVHKHIVIDSESVGIWVLGWILIMGVAYFLVRGKRK